MENNVDVSKTYCQSEDVVSREIEGEIIIIPITSDIGDMEEELYTLNDIGKDIWQRLDGKKNLTKIINELTREYDLTEIEIKKDVEGFVFELLKRRMVVES